MTKDIRFPFVMNYEIRSPKQARRPGVPHVTAKSFQLIKTYTDLTRNPKISTTVLFYRFLRKAAEFLRFNMRNRAFSVVEEASVMERM